MDYAGLMRKFLTTPSSWLDAVDARLVALGYFDSTATDAVGRYRPYADRWFPEPAQDEWIAITALTLQWLLFQQPAPIDLNDHTEPGLVIAAGAVNEYADFTEAVQRLENGELPVEAAYVYTAAFILAQDVDDPLALPDDPVVAFLMNHLNAFQTTEEAKRRIYDLTRAVRMAVVRFNNNLANKLVEFARIQDTRVESVRNVSFLEDRDDFAFEGHEHDYLRFPDVAQEARFGVDSNGVAYGPDAFAPTSHTHRYASLDQNDADFIRLHLLDNGTFTYAFVASEYFAPATHDHAEYANWYEGAKGAYFLGTDQKLYITYDDNFPSALSALLGDKIELLASADHNHHTGKGYVQLLKNDQVAVGTYKLNGLKPEHFARADHEHPEYVTVTDGDTLAVTTSTPLPTTPEHTRGVATNIGDVHVVFGQLSVRGTAELRVPDVVYAHVSIASGAKYAQLPVVEYIYGDEGRVVGVRLRASRPVVVNYFVAYQAPEIPRPKEC